MDTINDVVEQMQEDGMVRISFAAMAEKPTGAWPPGWYPAEITPGYLAGTTEFATGNTVSAAGDSYNLMLCFRAKRGEESKNLFRQMNYRPVDFSPERIETVQNLRAEFEGLNKWPGKNSEQRSSILHAQIGQLENATGVTVPFNPESGQIVPTEYIGKHLFIRLSINDRGYNEVAAFSRYPNGVEPNKKQKKSRSVE